jgi:hypothetical protein
VSSFKGERRQKSNFDLWFVQNPNSLGRGAPFFFCWWGGGGGDGEWEKWLLGSLLQMGTLWWRE